MFLRKILLTLFITLTFSNLLAADLSDIGNNDVSKVVGVTTLMSAAADNDIEGVKFFSKSDKSLIDQRNLGGATALHLAARQGHLEVVEILVKEGANVNITDNEGWTPLMRAALAGNSPIVKLLIEHGADVTKINSVGESVIINAANSQCFECLKIIFENSAFAERMDEKLLKQQLSDAFTISRNRGDKKSQDLLETYLNSLFKSEKDSSLPSIISSVVNPIATNNNSGKRYKLVGESSPKESAHDAPPKVTSTLKDVVKIPERNADGVQENKVVKRYIYNPTKDENDIGDKEVFSLKEAADEVKQAVTRKAKPKGTGYKFKGGAAAKAVAPLPAVSKKPVAVVTEKTAAAPAVKAQEAPKQPELKSAIVPQAKPATNPEVQKILEQKTDDKTTQPKFVIGSTPK